jgi:hypothetical protein
MAFQRALANGEVQPSDLRIPRDLVSKPTPPPSVEFTGGSLGARIFRFFGVNGDGHTCDEIAEGIGEPDRQRVEYALRDARAKAKGQLLDKPVDGKWSRNAKGKAYSKQLLAELTVPAVTEVVVRKKK